MRFFLSSVRVQLGLKDDLALKNLINPATSPFTIGDDITTGDKKLHLQISSAIFIGRHDPSHSSSPILCPTWPDNG